jgi:hypothetical protein
VQENQLGLKLNGKHQFLFYGDYANLMEDNMNTIKKNAKALFEASKEVGLEVNTEKNRVSVDVMRMQGRIIT